MYLEVRRSIPPSLQERVSAILEEIKSKYLPRILDPTLRFGPISVATTEFLNAILGESEMTRLDECEEHCRVHMYISYRGKVYEVHEENILHPLSKPVVNEKLLPEALKDHAFLESCRNGRGVNAYKVSNPSRIITLEDLFGHVTRTLQGAGPLVPHKLTSITALSLK